jgi:hypothetical protein
MLDLSDIVIAVVSTSCQVSAANVPHWSRAPPCTETPTFVVDSCYEPKYNNSDNNPRSRSTPTATMRSFATIVSLLLAYCTAVYATALTYRLDAHEKACFFANVEHKGTKVAFYFAVQSGGSFDIDYSVVGPGSNGGPEKVILDGTKERQGDFVFTANEVGEYRFCFNNEMSTFAEKLVDFEIAVRPPHAISAFNPSTVGSHTNVTELGRERSSPRRHSLQARLLPRTNYRSRRKHPQALRATVHHLPQPEVLPHAREPQLQHRQEHREARPQFLAHGGWSHGCHGGPAGRGCEVLFPGREERYLISFGSVCCCVLEKVAMGGRLCVSEPGGPSSRKSRQDYERLARQRICRGHVWKGMLWTAFGCQKSCTTSMHCLREVTASAESDNGYVFDLARLHPFTSRGSLPSTSTIASSSRMVPSHLSQIGDPDRCVLGTGVTGSSARVLSSPTMGRTI